MVEKMYKEGRSKGRWWAPFWTVILWHSVKAKKPNRDEIVKKSWGLSSSLKKHPCLYLFFMGRGREPCGTVWTNLFFILTGQSSCSWNLHHLRLSLKVTDPATWDSSSHCGKLAGELITHNNLYAVITAFVKCTANALLGSLIID